MVNQESEEQEARKLAFITHLLEGHQAAAHQRISQHKLKGAPVSSKHSAGEASASESQAAAHHAHHSTQQTSMTLLADDGVAEQVRGW